MEIQRLADVHLIVRKVISTGEANLHDELEYKVGSTSFHDSLRPEQTYQGKSESNPPTHSTILREFMQEVFQADWEEGKNIRRKGAEQSINSADGERNQYLGCAEPISEYQ